jgi:hypothetical protein
VVAIGYILLAIGVVLGLWGGIWLLVLAFREHILWGLGSLFVPFVGLIFAVMHWAKAGRPFLIALGGGVLQGIGLSLAGIDLNQIAPVGMIYLF